MDRSVVPGRVSARNSSAPLKCRSGGRTLDGELTRHTRRVNRLDYALEDARGESGYSLFSTPRLVRRRLPLSKLKSDRTAVDQLQNVYDRIEERNDALIPIRLPTLSIKQVKAAEQAVQAFVDKMRKTAINADEQTKSNLIRAMTNDMIKSRLVPRLSSVQQQNNEADVLNQLDEVATWYSVGKEIGRGTFGRVRLATHRLSGTPVAIKSYARLNGARSCLAIDTIAKNATGDSCGDALEWRRIRQEVNVLSKLRPHPNVMRFVEVFETPTRIHVVTESVRGTNLCEVLQRTPGQRLPETRAKKIFWQLVIAVEALHAQRVIHRDLKLENVLLDEHSGHATIIDFGFSDFEDSSEPDNNSPKKQSKKKNFCGTPAYMAPEVIASARYDGRPVDVWSLGVLLYVMLCGKFPFQGVSFHQLYQKLRSGAQQLVLPHTLSADARALLQSVLTVDPAKRPSASDLCHSSWLQNKENPQTSPLQNNVLRLAFEAWPGTQQVICSTLTELYDVPINLSGLDRTKTRTQRRTRLNAFLELATAVSCRQFQKIVNAAQPARSPSLVHFQTQQQENTEEVLDAQKSLENIEPASTRHKQQLEKLIGLVKSSLLT